MLAKGTAYLIIYNAHFMTSSLPFGTYDFNLITCIKIKSFSKSRKPYYSNYYSCYCIHLWYICENNIILFEFVIPALTY